MEPQTHDVKRLEEVIATLNDPALLAKSPSLKDQANDFLLSYAETHAMNGVHFLEILPLTSSLHTQFWALGVLSQLLQKSQLYESNYAISRREQLHDAMQTLAEKWIL